jgi:anti-anti-sigma regulatory factor
MFRYVDVIGAQADYHERTDGSADLVPGGETMFDIFLDTIGDVAVLQPDGRFVQADAVFALRYAVISQGNAGAIVLDLSEVEALEDGALEMLASLHQWICDHGIGLKLFNPSNLVRQRLERANWAWLPELASRGEVLAILAAASARRQSPLEEGIRRDEHSYLLTGG